MIQTQSIKAFADIRSQRAEAILQRGNPAKIDEFTYLVPLLNLTAIRSIKLPILIVTLANARILGEDVREQVFIANTSKPFFYLKNSRMCMREKKATSSKK
jgi:hypothetical protein